LPPVFGRNKISAICHAKVTFLQEVGRGLTILDVWRILEPMGSMSKTTKEDGGTVYVPIARMAK